MIKCNGDIIVPTIFPDKTSQVWKTRCPINTTFNVIDWTFENESEFIHVMQLADLVFSITNIKPHLNMPYLPYGRQDKEITNESTFALKTFISMIESSNKFKKISTIDAHNPLSLPKHWINHKGFENISRAIEKVNANLICFPDKGAALRYNFTPNIILDKARNQSTGEIIGLKIAENGYSFAEVNDLTILIVDDLCDGGRTFTEASKLLYGIGAKEVHLYVSHGIFSKGVEVLREAGIQRIFTKDGEVHGLFK